MMQLSPGTWVNPYVRLVRPLDAGGMATVWVAAHMRLHTQVAVKFVAPALLDEPNYRARFEREGELAKRIASPHMVQVFDQGVMNDKWPYMVMEWLEGETLKDRVERDHCLDPSDALAISKQIARALDAAHAVGVIHRDIKPANIFLLHGDKPLVKVLDLGIAKVIGGGTIKVVTDRRETLGTPNYMPPEQLRSASNADHRADIWSLGVVTYRMLFGQLPFQGEDFPEVCMRIVDADYVPPTEVDPDWGGPLDDWFVRTFQVQRERRFSSAGEASAALEAALVSLGGRTPAPLPRKV